MGSERTNSGPEEGFERIKGDLRGKKGLGGGGRRFGGRNGRIRGEKWGFGVRGMEGREGGLGAGGEILGGREGGVRGVKVGFGGVLGTGGRLGDLGGTEGVFRKPVGNLGAQNGHYGAPGGVWWSRWGYLGGRGYLGGSGGTFSRTVGVIRGGGRGYGVFGGILMGSRGALGGAGGAFRGHGVFRARWGGLGARRRYLEALGCV